jgi:hypothetical protein
MDRHKVFEGARGATNLFFDGVRGVLLVGAAAVFFRSGYAGYEVLLGTFGGTGSGEIADDLVVVGAGIGSAVLAPLLAGTTEGIRVTVLDMLSIAERTFPTQQ